MSSYEFSTLISVMRFSLRVLITGIRWRASSSLSEQDPRMAYSVMRSGNGFYLVITFSRWHTCCRENISLFLLPP
jgi:hypothetical protein